MKASRYLSFRNWKQHQHYTDRKPPWIKLHTNFHETTAHLSNDARLLACLLFCVAANKDNKIPADPHWLSVEVGMTKAQVNRGLADLLADRTLIPWCESDSPDADDSASESASNDASEDASPSRAPARSKEAETEAEAEREVANAPSLAAATAPPKKPRKPPKPRDPDPYWDRCVEVFGDVVGDSERGKRNKAVAEFKRIGVPLDEINRRAANYRTHFPDVAFTPNAVLGNWTTCDAPKAANSGKPDLSARIAAANQALPDAVERMASAFPMFVKRDLLDVEPPAVRPHVVELDAGDVFEEAS